MRIVVVGGGVIGLAGALRLADDGHAVVLLDAAAEAREASWAAGGMLAPHHEATGDDPLWRFGRRSLERWPAFLAEAGIAAAEVDFRSAGGLIPELDAADREATAARFRFLRDHGIACERLDATAAREREPALAPAIHGALALPAAQVDPRRLSGALTAACRRRGVELRYACPVTGITPGQVHLQGGERLSAELVVLASGAWTPALAGLARLDLPGEPVKGQMLRIAAADDLLGCFLHCRHAYCIPRAGRGIVVGATMVCSGFDRAEDPDAIAALRLGAERLLPALAGQPLLETWTGLRPRLGDGLPCIDRPRPDLIIATGHFRNGILLAPATADAIAGLVAGAPPPAGLESGRSGLCTLGGSTGC